MKKILKIFLTAITVLTITNCDNGFEELNQDPNSALQLDPGPKLTNTLLRTAGDRFENWRGNLIYSSTMIQHMSATGGVWAGDKYLYNAQWSGAWFERGYGDMVKSVEDLLSQLQTNADGEFSEEMVSIVRILRVFIYHKITDLYGDVPYSEAGKGFISGIFRPKYDPQSEIYADMLNELAEATAGLGTGASQLGSADILYQGSQEKWKRFGYSLMLRLGLRLIKVDPAASQQWAQRAIDGGVMQSNDDIAYIEHTLVDGLNRNGNGQVFSADGDSRLSDTFVNILNGDPRLTIYGSLPEDTGETDADGNAILRTEAERMDPIMQRGLPNGLNADGLLALTGETNDQAYTEANRLIITGEDAPYFFQTYAEVEFMLAEAALRWGIAGGDPATHYNNGVTAAMKFLALYGENAIISDSDIADYLTTNPYNPAIGLEQINTQYWVCTFLNDIESYANWRRTGFPVLTPVNFPGNESNGQIPRRLRYFEREQTANPQNYQEAITRQGPDQFTTRIWWDVE